MCFKRLIHQNNPSCSKCNAGLTPQASDDLECPILPGLPDDVAKHCLSLVPRSSFPAMGAVCKKWRSFIRSKEFLMVRKLAGLLEEWLYVLTRDGEEKASCWEVFDYLGHKNKTLPPMPGPEKADSEVVVLNGKLLVIAGYVLVDGARSASADVYQYDPFLNRFVDCCLFCVLAIIFEYVCRIPTCLAWKL